MLSSANARRFVWSAVALTSIAALVAARSIVPLAEGLGSHRALGLPACAFLACFDLPCPTCGLTTAFAHLARFQLGAALAAHPLGLPLFALALSAIPIAVRGLLRGDSILAAIDRFAADRVALALTLALLSTWFGRLAGLTR
jgi:hypothetical protein